MAARLRTMTAAFCLALAWGPTAHAATATLSASLAPEGYTRLEFGFDNAPKTDARLANGVLVISFSEPVVIKMEAMPKGAGALIGAIRRDPDGTAIRMSLNEQARAVATEAGERVFVDLLPASWKGLPPPLPAEVVADLSRQAREVQALKAEESRFRKRPERTLSVEGATQPTFRRLIFKLGGDVAVDWKRSGPVVAVTIGAPYAFDAGVARARLPLAFAGLDARRTDKAITVLVPAPGAGGVRGFKEDDDFILDIDRDDAPEAPAKASEAHPTAKPSGEQHAAAPAPAFDPHVATPAAHAPEPAAALVSPGHGEEPAPAHAGVKPAPASTTAEPREDRPPTIRRAGQTLRMVFPFSRAVPAAAFQRGRTLWLLFDAAAPMDFSKLAAQSDGAVLSAEPLAIDRGQGVRLKLAQPRLVSAAVEGTDWVVSLGDDVMNRSGSVEFAPARDRDGRPAVRAELAGLGAVRTLKDPEIGDELSVATLAPPARGLPAARQFVEFAGLPSAQGLVLSLHSDDVRVTSSIEQLSIERDGGLSLSPALAAATPEAKQAGEVVMDAAGWTEENARPFAEREAELMRGAALATVEDRPEARLALARFYQARGQAADSSAVLGAIVEDAGLSERDPRIAILRAAAEVQLGRPASALAILASPALKTRPEAALWRASAEALSGHPALARAALEDGAPALAQLPPALKARFIALAVDLALQSGDAETADARYRELEVLPASEGVAAREVMRARLEEAFGRKDKAAAAYAAVVRGGSPAAAAEADLRSVALGLKTGALAPANAVVRLERLVTGWRGDHVEAEALAKLIELYGDAGRWRDAFSMLRLAVQVFPEADETRALQDRMQNRFADLFLGDGLDKMPRLDALALFYDFKELAPGGKRGDELVRRLADKLVAVDLLDQAAELLDYQIDNRLTGAARAQVASRAALVALMNGKPAKAIEVLRKTRQADLPAQLMNARMRLEARALSQTGRVDLALEIAEGLEGEESRGLRADILWSARRWSEAGEAIEAALGSSWRGPQPLDPIRRADVMRAAIASALAGDALAVDRIRQKYAPKMADSPEAASFEIVTAPIEARGDAFREIARSVAASSSFQSFLDEYRKGAGRPADVERSASGPPQSKA